MSATASTARPHAVTWRPTKIMHIQDLPKDDDFLSHLLIEKLGTGVVPLLVHKMDPSRRLPKTSSSDLMKITRRYVTSKLLLDKAIKQAVDDLLTLPSIRYYLKPYTQKQINAFATHASRYFELYHPAGSIEIAHTSRYSHRTGKSELCILATRSIPAHTVVTELKGSMANLTEEEDQELKRTDLRNSDTRRDFSVIHSKSMKKNHLFLGPARFVNHDCNNNCELFREGRYITFRTLRAIAVGEELTAHYGDGYFGKKNKHCLCETCEKNGRGGYAPHRDEDSSDTSSSDDSDSDADSSSSSSSSDTDAEKTVLNLNERRTRRGVYAISKPASESSDESEDDEDDNTKPLANAADIPADGDIELTAAGSDVTSIAHSSCRSGKRLSGTTASGTPNHSPSSSLTELTPSSGVPSMTSNPSTSFRSIISTRSQKAREATRSQSSTPVKLTSSVLTPGQLTRSVPLLRVSEKAKGKEKASPAPSSGATSAKHSKGQDDSKGKNEEDNNRVRTRPDIIKEIPKASEVPRGPDGKPLPTCATCANVLPLISVDSKVIWGLETAKKDRNIKRECPRCLRHFAIYEVAWPRRVPPPGASATPREESAPAEINTKNVTKDNLPVIDRQIAAAVSVSSSRGSKKSRKRPQELEPEPERTGKKRKQDPAESATAVRKLKVIFTYGRADKRRLNPPVTHTHKTRSQNVKEEEPAGDAEKLILQPQPRANNGRFARKNKTSDAALGQSETGGVSRKRRNEELDEPEEWPRRKKSSQAGEEVTKKVVPFRASGFRAGRLFSNPNPQQFAVKAWSEVAWSTVVVDDLSMSSEEDDSHPVTPEDNFSPAADVVDPDEGESTNNVAFLRSTRTPLSCINPSPLAFAKSRWNSFGQTRTIARSGLSLRKRSLDEMYVSEVEPSSPLPENTPRSDDYISDDESLRTHFRPTYPVLSPSAALKPCIPKGTRFFSANSGTKPTLVNAGWDDTSDVTEA